MPDVMASSEAYVWQVSSAVPETARLDLGKFAPHWVYPGGQGGRPIITCPLSRDFENAERLVDDPTLHRLTLVT